MGLFSIFCLEATPAPVSTLERGLPSRSPRDEQPAFAQVGFGAAAFTRFASEGWWARQDSNLQPDRYERLNSDQIR